MNKIIKTLTVLGAIVASLSVLSAHAIEPFIISDIRVEGLERLDEGTVFNYLPLKVGDEMNDEEAQISIKELFRTGFFRDVKLEQDGGTLVVQIQERPSIAKLTIKGNKELETEALRQGLETSGIVEGRIFNQGKLEQVSREIKNTYLSLGRYSAEVTTDVEDLGDNKVALSIDINEGRVARIKKINIIGATKISASTLKDEMELRDRRGFSLFSKRNQYSRQKLEADVESIRSYYLNRGYHDFEITSTNVQISPNKQDIFISISLSEGERYVFGGAVVEGAESTGISGLDSLIRIQQGEAFSQQEVSASRAAIADRLADEGYAFVEVKPIYDTDRENLVVSTVFSVVPNQRVYVRRINISGNAYTRDEVIRRELRQFEGAWYSAAALRKSRGRLQRLGFFTSVQIETPAVPGTTDQIDVNVIVSERDTGSIQLSAGYSDSDGTIIGASYQQRNLLGTGRELTVEISNSDASRVASVDYVNPYHTEDGISRGFNLTTRRIDSSEVDTAEYVLNTDSAGINYRIPISESNSITLGGTLEFLDLESTDETPPEILRVIEETPEADNVVLTIGLAKDTRDDFFFPTRGANGSASLEISVPGSDFEYYKLNLQGAAYYPLTDNLTLKGSLGLGYGDGFGDSSETGLPFYKNYFAGGSRSVRGFDGRSLGPRDTGPTPAPLGGDRRVLVNAELLFPPFGESIDKDKRVGIFIDGGQVYGPDEDLDLGELRYSAGLAFNWFSPLGPFSLSYGIALNDEEDDELEEFQISFGTVFR
ncbi:MAG: outer membrane protein assembly factor BamA [Pseudomonadota bacterium]